MKASAPFRNSSGRVFSPTRRRVLTWKKASLAGLLLLGLSLGAVCSRSGSAGGEERVARRTLTLGAYTTPREVYGKAILPAFRRFWRAQHGEDVEFRQSYMGSGAQARAILGGFEADVAALSHEADMELLRREGLVRKDWKRAEQSGIVTRSLVVLGVRRGNPRGIRGWEDLRQPGMRVLTPNVRTSGGAMWNIAAIYGAALRGGTGLPAGDTRAAEGLLREVLSKVRVMDHGARESMLNFERGVGDVVITYENEILAGLRKGKEYDYVVPESTILIENPVAVVSEYARKHRNLDLAQAFVRFLYSDEAQRAFADYGLRPVRPEVAEGRFSPLPAKVFSIRELGGWKQVKAKLFAQGGAYDRAFWATRRPRS